ncbi:hypothetical protein DFP72DRAFT_847336 [Ephemerocybe angulata]|uniref:Uncharacterized protein n=1 Tax=Ephemerocybe angulata TaxID=980116 RepID=A0A8H6M4R2_9AGAR|nr:hypothetical protein DFP72DRAFT_847336 [Tulosesus angulatus]
MEGVEILQYLNRADEEAKTLQCNRCSRKIFGDMDVYSSECCGTLAELLCSFCWDDITRNAERCPKQGCMDAFLKPVPVYWGEDTDSPSSKARDEARQDILKGDPRFRALKDEIDLVKRRADRQTQQIADKTHMQATLDDQIRQTSTRVEAVQHETATLKEFVARSRARTDEVNASNAVLEAKIARINEQTEALRNRAASQS